MCLLPIKLETNLSLITNSTLSMKTVPSSLEWCALKKMLGVPCHISQLAANKYEPVVEK